MAFRKGRSHKFNFYFIIDNLEVINTNKRNSCMVYWCRKIVFQVKSYWLGQPILTTKYSVEELCNRNCENKYWRFQGI